MLYRNGAPHTSGVVAVGGAHFTNDLSIGLRLTEVQAEKLKLRFGRALVQSRDRNEKVWLDGNFSIGDRQFSRQAIENITAARAWATACGIWLTQSADTVAATRKNYILREACIGS